MPFMRTGLFKLAVGICKICSGTWIPTRDISPRFPICKKKLFWSVEWRNMFAYSFWEIKSILCTLIRPGTFIIFDCQLCCSLIRCLFLVVVVCYFSRPFSSSFDLSNLPLDSWYFHLFPFYSKQFCPMLDWKGQNRTKWDIKSWNNQQQ